MNSKPVKVSSGGFPGLDYIKRVGTVWFNAMLGQEAMLNSAWKDMKDGNYGYKSIMKTWAGTLENMSSIAVEASRGPGFIREPVWLFFDYKRATPSTLEGTATIPRPEAPSAEPDCTPFFSVGAPKPIPGVYVPIWSGQNYSEIQVSLNTSKLAKATDGLYTSFIFVKGRTSEPPLVIVVLNVSP